MTVDKGDEISNLNVQSNELLKKRGEALEKLGEMMSRANEAERLSDLKTQFDKLYEDRAKELEKSNMPPVEITKELSGLKRLCDGALDKMQQELEKSGGIPTPEEAEKIEEELRKLTDESCRAIEAFVRATAEKCGVSKHSDQGSDEAPKLEE